MPTGTAGFDGPCTCLPCLVPVPSALLFALSCPCTVRALARLVLFLHDPRACSTGPVPVSAAQHFVWPCPCTVYALACLDPAPSVRLLVRSCLCVVCAPAWLALSLYRPRPCSPCIIPVWSAILLGLVLACTAGFDGSPSCSTGPLQARSAILLASSCPRTVGALARPFPLPSVLWLTLLPHRPPGFLPSPATVRSARPLVWTCSRTVCHLACLASSSHGPRYCLPIVSL